MRSKGYLPVRDFENSAFDAIRDDAPCLGGAMRFKTLNEIAEKETAAEADGLYLVLQTPLFKLEEFLTVATEPPLPTADTLHDAVTVILTGPALSKGMGGDDIRLLENLTGTGTKIMARELTTGIHQVRLCFSVSLVKLLLRDEV